MVRTTTALEDPRVRRPAGVHCVSASRISPGAPASSASPNSRRSAETTSLAGADSARAVSPLSSNDSRRPRHSGTPRAGRHAAVEQRADRRLVGEVRLQPDLVRRADSLQRDGSARGEGRGTPPLADARDLDAARGLAGIPRAQRHAPLGRGDRERAREEEILRVHRDAPGEGLERARDDRVEVEAAAERHAEGLADRGEIRRGELHLQRVARAPQRSLRDEARLADGEVGLRIRDPARLPRERGAARRREAREPAALDVEAQLSRRPLLEASPGGERGVQFAGRHLRERGGVEALDAAFGAELPAAGELERSGQVHEGGSARKARLLHLEAPARDARLAPDLEARVGERHGERLRVDGGLGRDVSGEARGAQRGLPRAQVRIAHGELRVELARGPGGLALRLPAAREDERHARRLHAILADRDRGARRFHRQALLVERAGQRVHDRHRPREDGALPRRELRVDRELRVRHGGEGGEVHPLELRLQRAQGHAGEGLVGGRGPIR